MKQEGKDNSVRYPIKDNFIKKDQSLEKCIFEMQGHISDLERMLQDYIYMGSNSINYTVIKERTREEFYSDFDLLSTTLTNDIDFILKCFTEKKLDDYTLLMRLLDENSPHDISWVHYNFIIIERVFRQYVSNIMGLNRPEIPYEHFHELEGFVSFLREMIIDLSSISYDFYILKARNYRSYLENGQVEEENNPFIRYDFMQRMFKTHKAASRTLLDTSRWVLQRSFYKDDMNAVPIVTTLIRQMIELRFEECFGIKAIYTNKNHEKVAKVVGSTYFDLPGLELATMIPVPLDMIKRIYGWASEFVHRGVSDYYWIIYYVRQYLLDFILGNVYMEMGYYLTLKEKIAKLFNVTVDCIVWQQFPINLNPVTWDELEGIRNTVKNKGYQKFRDREWERDSVRFSQKIYEKKCSAFRAIGRIKPFVFKIDSQYFLLSNLLCEECTNDDVKKKYEDMILNIKKLGEEFSGMSKDLRTERLEKSDLHIFVPLFEELCVYCNEAERRAEANWTIEHPDDTSDYELLKKNIEEKMNSFMSGIREETVDQILLQLSDFRWLSEQSTRYEVLMD